jgi:hypothetical protein
MLAAIDELVRTEAFLLDSKQAYDNLDVHLNVISCKMTFLY